MSNDSYTVPTLSLTNSRSKKNIPTKDAYQPKTYSYEPTNFSITPNPYTRQQPRTNFPEMRSNKNYFNLPPKPRANDIYPPLNPKRQVKQISRNVYLSSEQQSSNNIQNFPPKNKNYPETVNVSNSNFLTQDRPSSRNSIMGSSQARVQIQNEVKRQTNNMEFKKIDINKALFERKLSKILQQIQFYDEELNGLYTESLSDHLEQLENIKQENKKVHTKILSNLDSLIA